MNRLGWFWANTLIDESVVRQALSVGGDCFTLMPENISILPRIREERPNAYIEIRVSNYNWLDEKPEDRANILAEYYHKEIEYKGQRLIAKDLANGFGFGNERDIEPCWVKWDPGWEDRLRDRWKFATEYDLRVVEEVARLCPGIVLHTPAEASEIRLGPEGSKDPKEGIREWAKIREPLLRHPAIQVIGSHNYWSEKSLPSWRALYDPEARRWHAFRYREVRQVLLEMGINKPFFIEEFGNFGPDLPSYPQDIMAFLRGLEDDADFVIGACLFILRSDGANFVNDVSKRVPSFAAFCDYLRQQPKKDLPYPALKPAGPPDCSLAFWHDKVPRTGYDPGPAKKTAIVIHSTEGKIGSAINWFLSLLSKVSYHYLVAQEPYEDGRRIIQMVREEEIAYHAGIKDWNVKSIGIGLEDGGVGQYTEEQLKDFGALCRDIMRRHSIGPEAIWLHREILPDVKKDPHNLTKEQVLNIIVGPPPVPPPVPTPAPMKTLKVKSRRPGAPVIMGPLGTNVRLTYWGHEARVVPKPEFGQNWVEVSGWPPCNALFDLYVDGERYPIEVKIDHPWTEVEWQETPVSPTPPASPAPEPMPVPPPAEPTPEGPQPLPNPFGIHAGLNMAEKALAADLELVKEMGLGWVLLVPCDELQLRKAVRIFNPAGIAVVARPYTHIDRYHDFVQDVRIMLQEGVRPYIHIHNEPGDSREWASGQPNIPLFVVRWVDIAEAVINAGGWPGLQVTTPEHLRMVIQETRRRGRMDIWRKAWFCPHNYGLNHPPGYPDDRVNQDGEAISEEVYRHFQWASSREMVNRWRSQDKNPGHTVQDDYSCALGFLAFQAVFKAELGYAPPFLAGEGGWQYGGLQDRRYPRVDDEVHALYHVEMYRWLKERRLPSGEDLPDNIWGFAPWILSGIDADAWVSSIMGIREKTIAAVKKFIKGG
jgi:hypothetical protein